MILWKLVGVPMSFLPKLGPEEFEDLFKLFTAAIYQVGISPKEARGLQIQLRERLQKIWDATDPGLHSDSRHAV